MRMNWRFVTTLYSASLWMSPVGVHPIARPADTALPTRAPTDVIGKISWEYRRSGPDSAVRSGTRTITMQDYVGGLTYTGDVVYKQVGLGGDLYLMIWHSLANSYPRSVPVQIAKLPYNSPFLVKDDVPRSFYEYRLSDGGAGGSTAISIDSVLNIKLDRSAGTEITRIEFLKDATFEFYDAQTATVVIKKGSYVEWPKYNGFARVSTTGTAIRSGSNSSSPREELREALSLFRADSATSDPALRDRIIRLAQTLDPPPAVPDEVAEFTGRAVYAFKNASSESDYNESIAAYKHALMLAPWVAKNYYNLGVVQEKASNPIAAIESFRWYLVAAPDASDATEVRERIGGLKFAATKVAAVRQQEEAAATAEREKRETFLAFKSAVQGLQYEQMICSAPADAARGVTRGCNQADYHGNNWYTKLGGFIPPRAYWVFHDDYAQLECAAGCTPLRIRAMGNGFENLVVDWQGDIDPLPDRWYPLTLMSWNSSFSEFFIGFAPSRKDVLENPNKQYLFKFYRAVR